MLSLIDAALAARGSDRELERLARMHAPHVEREPDDAASRVGCVKGVRYGRWTVIEVGKPLGLSGTMITVLCDCGRRDTRVLCRLIAGRTTQCMPCRRRERSHQS